MHRVLWALVLAISVPAAALADPLQVGIPSFGKGSDSRVLKALDVALGDALDVAVDDRRIRLTIDPAELPRSSYETKEVVRNFATELDPESAALQKAQYGFFLPEPFNSDKRTVLLIHGLNSGKGRWRDLAALLEADGYQVAYFVYPNDQPISKSAADLEEKLGEFRREYPSVTTDVISHSLGSLVARWYIEGPTYTGGIDRFIMLSPPNRGSQLAALACVTEVHEHYWLRKTHPEWDWKWALTDGLGEGAMEVSTCSAMLDELNEHSRCEGVKYTIIAGNRNNAQRYTADLVQKAASKLPDGFGGDRVERWIGRQTGKLRKRTGSGDGAVRVDNTFLDGVDDIVVLAADHTTIYCSRNGELPVSWPAIQDRLARK